MPIATVDPAVTVRVDLQSCEGGYVELRPLPYGKKLERRDKQAKMFMRARSTPAGKGRMSQPSNEDAVMEFETANEWAVQFDFAYCVVDHNLTDTNEKKLDFASPMTFKMLDPRIGTEIEYAIADLNELEDEETSEDFLKRLSESSETQKETSPTDLPAQTDAKLVETP